MSETLLVQCYSISPPFEEGETYYADAHQAGDEVRYAVSMSPSHHGYDFNEAEFKKHFKVLQNRSSTGKRSYGGFKIGESVNRFISGNLGDRVHPQEVGKGRSLSKRTKEWKDAYNKLPGEPPTDDEIERATREEYLLLRQDTLEGTTREEFGVSESVRRFLGENEVAATIMGDGQRYACTDDGKSAWPVHEKSRVGRLHPGDKVMVTPPSEPDGYATVVSRTDGVVPPRRRRG